MKIYLMRHSETDWNRQGLVQGQTDIQLNTNGIKIACLAGDGMKDIPFDVCYTSPLIRAQSTAALILARNPHFVEKGAITKLDARLMEMNFGIWEGKNADFGSGDIPKEQYRAFFREDPTYHPEGAETVRQVVDRTGEFLRELVEKEGNTEKTIMVMSHGCAIRCMLRGFSDDPDYFTKPGGHVPFNCEAAAILETDENGELKIVERHRLFYDESFAENLYGPDKKQ